MIRRYRYVYKGNKDIFDSDFINKQNSDNKNRKAFFTKRSYKTGSLNELQAHAITLRQAGKSYNEIARDLQIPKSTLSSWFRGETYAYIKKQNLEKNRKAAGERLFELSKEKKKRLFKSYDEAIKEAGDSFVTYRNDPTFIAGLMIYAGEGDKTTRCHIRISNADWRMHHKFIQFLEKYLLFPREKVKVQILGYKNQEISDLKQYWGHKLGLGPQNFHKVQISKGKNTKRLQFGVAMSIINSTKSKYTLMEWINLYLDETEVAGMV